MNERLDPFNQTVVDKVARDLQHERNCHCMRCLDNARHSTLWITEQRHVVRATDSFNEQQVIDSMARTETQEQMDLRMMNMLGETDIERMLALVAQSYGNIRDLMRESD